MCYAIAEYYRSMRTRWLALVILVLGCSEDDENGDVTGSGDGASDGGATMDGGATTDGDDGTSGGADGTSGDGTDGTDGTGDGTGDGGGPDCVEDEFEPNDDEGSASDLGQISDCDGDGFDVSGDLFGVDDTDWLSFEGEDTFGCEVDATASIIATSALRFCMFADCVSGDTNVSPCSGDAIAAATDTGVVGCCAPPDSSANLRVSFDCPSIDDTANILFRVDQAADDVCIAYTVDFHY